jgi:hypothetical protein
MGDAELGGVAPSEMVQGDIQGLRRFLLLGAVVLAASSCTRVFYATNEKFGREKRDILASRVKDTRKEQEKAKEQFQTTLEAFQAVTGFKGGELEEVYKKLNREYERSEDRTKEVRGRISSVERVANDMFREWGKEIDQIGDRDLKAKSRSLMRATQGKCNSLLVRMKESEVRMLPVLRAFRDQVLYLKHNLNAQAIQSLRETSIKIDADVAALVREMEASIREADAFVAALEKGGES